MAVVVGNRNVADTPANQALAVSDYAYDLACYTIHICANKNVFLPEFQSSFTDDIVRIAKDVYLKIWTANNIYVNDINDFELRHKYQEAAVRDCNNLLALIGLSKKVFHLKSKRIEYWSNKVVNTKKYLIAWKNSDTKRYNEKFRT